MHEVIKRWLYVREALRRFGFAPDQLHFHYQDAQVFGEHNEVALPAGHVILCVVQAQGKEFVGTVGVIEAAEASAVDINRWYDAAVAEWNAGRVHNDAEWRAYMSLEQMISLGLAIQAKGLVVPGFESEKGN